METYRDAARRKDFVLSAGLFLKPQTDDEALGLQLDVLRAHVDGVLLTDNQGGKPHLAPLAAASLVLARGVDPIVQFACRNRNRIALLAELLGAAALGVSSLVLVRGNRVPDGFDPRPKAVLDVNANELIALAHRLGEDRELAERADFYVGSDFTLHRPAPDWKPEKLLTKSASGAGFVLSNLCLDLDVLRRYMTHIVAAGLTRELNICVSVPIAASAEDARWLRDARPNNLVPDALVRRLDESKDAEQEGIRIAAEVLEDLREIPGVSGAHLVATRNLAAIPEVIEAAGLGPVPS